jgi:hypothetical protein
VLARRRTSKFWTLKELHKALLSDLIITSNVARFESILQDWKALDQLNKLRNFFWNHVICALRVQRACKRAKLLATFFSDLTSECQCNRRWYQYNRSWCQSNRTNVSISELYIKIAQKNHYIVIKTFYDINDEKRYKNDNNFL